MLECAFCDSQFFHEKDLESHLFLHITRPVYECVYCQSVYSKKAFLNEHLKVHEKYIYGCRFCPAKFETEMCLLEHEKTHSSSGNLVHIFRRLKANQVRPDDDEVTVVEFVSPMPIQSPRPRISLDFFECEKCNLKFKRLAELRKHNVIHTRKSSGFFHICAKCHARFKNDRHLLMHCKAAHKQACCAAVIRVSLTYFN